MIYIVQNILPILVACIAGLVLGAVWLKLAGRPWPGASTWVLAALCLFWLAAILAGALILAPEGAGAWTMALGSALIIWVGFVLPAFAATLRAVGTPWRDVLWAVSYWLAAMLMQAAIMQAIGLAAPPVS